MKEYAESSPSIGTALNPYIGYEVAAEIIKESTKTGRSVREVVKRRKLMTDEELDRALDVARDDRAAASRSVRRHVVPRGFEKGDHRGVPRQSRDRAQQVRRVPDHRCCVAARRGDPLVRRHRATRACCSTARRVREQAGRRRAPVRLRQPAILLGVHRRARAVQHGWAVRDLRRHREAASPARAREHRPRDRHLALRGRAGVVVVPHRARGDQPRTGARHELVAATSARRSHPSCPSCCSRTPAR